jgi:hypothetical protein
MPGDTSEDSSDVGVDNRNITFECKRQHGASSASSVDGNSPAASIRVAAA